MNLTQNNIEELHLKATDVEFLPLGFSLHKVIRNEKGVPIDYVFLKVNTLFEKYTGLDRKKILKKKVTEIIPGIENDKFKWIEYYGEIASKANSFKALEQYSDALDKWYYITVFCPKEDYFVTYFNDVSHLKKQALDLKTNNEEYVTLNEEYLAQNEELQSILDELKEKQSALREKESLLDSVIESTNNGVLVVDGNGQILYRNEKFNDLWKIPKKLAIENDEDKLLKYVLSQLAEPDEFLELVRSLKISKETNVEKIRFKDGRIFERFSSPLYTTAGIGGRIWNFRDLTDKIQTGERLKYLNSVLNGIRSVNRIQSKEDNPKELIQRACDELCKTMNYDAAWITLIDEKMGVKAVANHGHVKTSKELENILISNPELPCHKKVIENKGLQVVMRPELECNGCELKKYYNNKSILVSELKNRSKSYGFFKVVVPRTYSEDIEVNELFKELSDDIAYSISKIETEEKQKNITNRRKQSEARLRSIFKSAPVGIGVVKDRVISDVNQRFCEMTGFNKNELLGKDSLILYPSKEEYELVGKLKYDQIREFGIGTVETKFQHKNGLFIDILLSSAPIDQDDWSKGVTFSALDITEKKKDRRDSEVLQKAIESSSEEIYLIDAETLLYKFANRKATENLQYTQEEFLHLNPAIILNKYTLGEFRRFVKSLSANPEMKFKFQSEHVRKDGSAYPVEIHLSYLNYEEEKYYLAFAFDISHRKLAEEKIKSSEEKFRVAFNTSPDAININRWKDGLFLNVNEGFTRLTDYTMLDVKGKTSEDINIWYDQNDRKKVLKELRENNYVSNIEVKFKSKYRGIKNVLLSASIITVENEKCILSVARDITSLHLMKKKLSLNERKYKTLVERMGEGVMIVDLEEKILFANQSAGYIFETSVNDLEGRNLAEFLTARDLQLVAENTELRKSGEITTYEVDFRMERSNKKTILVTGSPHVNENGEIIGTLGIFRDITQRKKFELDIKRKNDELQAAEEELKATNDELNHLNQVLESRNKALEKAKERAIEADRLKSAFLANMSHEIRTPMNGMLGFAELLKSPKLKSEKKNRFIDIINSNAQQLLTIIDDIIDISKIEANQLVILPDSENISKIIKDLQLTYLRKILENEKKGLEIICDLPQGEDIITNCDGNRLKQVISNLVGNAIKFTPKGSITIGVKIKNANTLLFYVQDTGIGIPKRKQGIVFERFRQIEYGSTRNYGGTGLGLTISKRLVNLMGGEIWLESIENKGTTFFFTLPYLKTEEKVLEDAAYQNFGEELNLKNKNVLIVEDSESSYLYLESLFEDTQAFIYHANSGEKAMEIFGSKNIIDLILLDVQLPGIDGLEVARRIRMVNKEIPIIAQTAYAMADDRAKCIAAGCSDYISKPINSDELKGMIKKYLKL